MRGDYATQSDLAMGFNNSAVLNSLNDLTLKDLAGLSSCYDLLPVLVGVDSGLVKSSNTVDIAYLDNLCLHNVAELVDFIKLCLRVGSSLIVRDNTSSLGAEVEVDLIRVDRGNNAFDDISCI